MSLLERKHVRPRYIYALYFLDVDLLSQWTVYVGCTHDPVMRRRQHKAAWPWPFLMVILHTVEADAREAEKWESAYRSAAQAAGCKVLILGKSGPRFDSFEPYWLWTRPGVARVLWPTPPAVQRVSHSIFYTASGASVDDGGEWSPLSHLIVVLPAADVTKAEGLSRVDKTRLKKTV